MVGYLFCELSWHWRACSTILWWLFVHKGNWYVFSIILNFMYLDYLQRA